MLGLTKNSTLVAMGGAGASAGMSEPGAGTDVMGMRTTAVPDGADHWVLPGARAAGVVGRSPRGLPSHSVAYVLNYTDPTESQSHIGRYHHNQEDQKCTDIKTK